MAHEEEYFENMVTTLELLWGEGYMAPGGPGNVAKLLAGLATSGKRILDIGCGIGGPAFEMARTHGARVVGIDLEAPLIERAKRAATKQELSDRCDFQTVIAGPLAFDDESFDIVTSAGAFTQTADKAGLLAESLRVLKPGGTLSCYEWLKSPGEYSKDMLYWFEVEGLTYALATLEDFRDQFVVAGFTGIRSEDATAWYRTQVHLEYDLIRGELYPRMVELIGQKDADHFVEDWRAMAIVIDKNEMRQGYLRGRRP
jgi:ubiquinone/menaquinone biosynthesis C-methylase UbiE